MASAGTELRALREHPFDLLREMERRSRLAITGNPGDDANAEEWVGIGLRLGNERFVVGREEIREVLMLPSALTRVPGAKAWVRGLANVRGHLLPIADLRGFLGGGDAPPDRAARVLGVNSTEFPVGLLVDEVRQVVRLTEDDMELAATGLGAEVGEFVLGIGRQQGEFIVLLDLAAVVSG
jgi:twitching motility protein PilI